MRILHCKEEGAKTPFSYKKLFIASLSYNGHFCADFVASLTKTLKILFNNNIDVDVFYANNDPFIERARNMLVSQFLSSDCTHILMIDSDQGWQAERVLDMLNLDYDVIAGAVPIKNPEKEDYILKLIVDNQMFPVVDENGMLEADLIGAAFMMIKKSVFTTIIDKNPSRYCFGVAMNYYQFFEVIKDGHTFYGEDMTFCKRIKECGFKINVMPDINFSHIGFKSWKGNYNSFLCSQPKEDESDIVMKRTSEMIKSMGLNIS